MGTLKKGFIPRQTLLWKKSTISLDHRIAQKFINLVLFKKKTIQNSLNICVRHDPINVQGRQ